MDANKSQIAFQRETTWGVVPGSPDTTKARLTSESLMHSKETVVSKEVRSDRMKADAVKVGASAGGNLNFELSYGDFKHWLEAALFGTLSTVSVAATVGVVHTTGIITGTAGDFNNVVPGCSIRIAGFATGANNGIKQVIAKAANGSTITCATGSFTATETGVAITATGLHLKNGSDEHSYYIERKVPTGPAAFEYQRFAGMMVDSLDLTLESKAIVTGQIGFVGKIGSTNTDPLDAAPTEPTSNSVVNATNNIGSITRNGLAMTEKFKKLSLKIANNLRGRDAVGTEGSFSVGIGSFDLTGSLESYFAGNSLLDAYINHDYTSLGYRVTDPDGNVIVFEIPRLVLTSGNAGISGLDTDVMVPLDFQALRSPTYDATLLISFIPAP